MLHTFLTSVSHALSGTCKLSCEMRGGLSGLEAIARDADLLANEETKVIVETHSSLLASFQCHYVSTCTGSQATVALSRFLWRSSTAQVLCMSRWSVSLSLSASEQLLQRWTVQESSNADCRTRPRIARSPRIQSQPYMLLSST